MGDIDWKALFTAFFGALVVALPNIIAVWYKARQQAADMKENTLLTKDIHEEVVPDSEKRQAAAEEKKQ